MRGGLVHNVAPTPLRNVSLLWVLPRSGKRNILGKDTDETEYLKNKEMRMLEFLILDKKGFIFLGPSMMIPY